MEQATNDTESATPACAACKYQRKKCSENCILAPFFPAEKKRSFQAANRLFGLSNLQKRIKDLDPNLRQTAANALVWEARSWHRDPINGAYGEYVKLLEAFNAYKKTCTCNYQDPRTRNLLGQDIVSSSSPVIDWNANMQVTEGDFVDHGQNNNNINNALLGYTVYDWNHRAWNVVEDIRNDQHPMTLNLLGEDIGMGYNALLGNNMVDDSNHQDGNRRRRSV